MIRILAVLAALVFAVPAVAQQLPANLDKANAIVIDSTKGRIVIKLRTDIAPQHAERIKQLAREGFYNNVPFHRVMDGFMAQTGDGQNFNGTGGSKSWASSISTASYCSAGICPWSTAFMTSATLAASRSA